MLVSGDSFREHLSDFENNALDEVFRQVNSLHEMQDLGFKLLLWNIWLRTGCCALAVVVALLFDPIDRVRVVIAARGTDRQSSQEESMLPGARGIAIMLSRNCLAAIPSLLVGGWLMPSHALLTTEPHQPVVEGIGQDSIERCTEKWTTIAIVESLTVEHSA